MTGPSDQSRTGSALDRFLRLFTEVRAGESATALLLCSNVFVLLTAYSILKVLREPLILAGGSGAELRAYSSAGQALLLLGIVPLYGWVAGRVPRRRLIDGVTMVFVMCLVLFIVLARLQLPLGVPFFLYTGLFGVMIVAQFWGFANDVYSNDEGKRLFPIVGFGASAGAVFGAWLSAVLLPRTNIYSLMFVAAVLLLLTIALSRAVDRRERRRTEAHLPDIKASGILPAATSQIRTVAGELKAPTKEHLQASGTFQTIKSRAAAKEEEKKEEEKEEEKVASTGGGFQLVARNRYLLLIALLVLLLNWVNTTGEYILAETVSAAARAATDDPAAQVAMIGAFYGWFQMGVNVAGLILQLFVVSRVIKYLGVGIAVLILPLIALGGYAILAFYPILTAVRWAKTAENATDYSLNNTVRNVLFLPTTREEKYKAKQVTDSFAQRLGDTMQAVTVFVGLNLLGFETRHFAMFNIGLVLIWLVVAWRIGIRYKRLVATTESASVTA